MTEISSVSLTPFHTSVSQSRQAESAAAAALGVVGCVHDSSGGGGGCPTDC